MARPSAGKAAVAAPLPTDATKWVRKTIERITDDPSLKKLVAMIYRTGYEHGFSAGRAQGRRTIPSAGGAAMRGKSIPKLISILVIHDLIAEQQPNGKVSYKELAGILSRNGIKVEPNDGQIKRPLRARPWLEKLTVDDL